MAKSSKRTAPAVATQSSTNVGAVAAPTNVTAQGTAVPQVIVAVKAGVKFRGARLAWYAVLQQHVGKPAADFLAATTANPPSVPKSGIAEKSSGWLSYFTRTGIAQVK